MQNPFAQSQAGQNYGDYLRYLGFNSPKEYAEKLSLDEKVFWLNWYNEKMKRLSMEANK